MITVDRVDVRGMRGIRQCTVDLDGKWLYLLGENGTGKSSLIDSLEYFFTGGVRGLEGTHSLSPRRYLHHIDADPGQMRVSMRFKNKQTEEITRSQSGYTSAVPTGLCDYFRSASRGTFILHRAQLLQFIYDTPGDRFSDLEGIMGVQDLDETEKNMQRMSAKSMQVVQRLENQRQDVLTQFRIRVGAEALDDAMITGVINAKLEAIEMRPLRSLDRLVDLSEKLMLGAKLGHLREKTVGQLISARDAATAVSCTNIDLSLLEAIRKAYTALATTATQEQLKVAGLLEDAQSIMAVGSTYASTCPVCEQPIELPAILARLQARLAGVAQQSEAAARLKAYVSTLRDVIGAIAARLDSMLSDMSTELWTNTGCVSRGVTARHRADGLYADLDGAGWLKAPVDTDRLIAWVEECCKWGADVTAIAAGMLSTQELSSVDRVTLELASLVEYITSTKAEIGRLDQELRPAKAKAHTAETYFESLRTAKQSVVQSVYNQLQGRIETYYKELHPSEGYANVRLLVNTVKRASTTLGMDALGTRGEDPRAYCSEGHLDSLGLVIFLAFAKEFQDQCSLLVLDDVVTTIDSQHRLRICDLLCDEFSDRQLVVTTHDPSWFEELLEATREHGLSDKVVPYCISGWTRSEGPNLQPYRSRAVFVADCLQRGDTGTAMDDGRSHLESILKGIAEQTGASVRFRGSGQYESQELLGVVRQRVKEMSNLEFKERMLTALDALEAVKFVGNFLAHDSAGAKGLSAVEVAAFCSAVDGLETASSCPSCGQRLVYDVSGKQTCCVNRQCSTGIVSRFS